MELNNSAGDVDDNYNDKEVSDAIDRISINDVNTTCASATYFLWMSPNKAANIGLQQILKLVFDCDVEPKIIHIYINTLPEQIKIYVSCSHILLGFSEHTRCKDVFTALEAKVHPIYLDQIRLAPFLQKDAFKKSKMPTHRVGMDWSLVTKISKFSKYEDIPLHVVRMVHLSLYEFQNHTDSHVSGDKFLLVDAIIQNLHPELHESLMTANTGKEQDTTSAFSPAKPIPNQKSPSSTESISLPADRQSSDLRGGVSYKETLEYSSESQQRILEQESQRVPEPSLANDLSFVSQSQSRVGTPLSHSTEVSSNPIAIVLKGRYIVDRSSLFVHLRAQEIQREECKVRQLRIKQSVKRDISNRSFVSSSRNVLGSPSMKNTPIAMQRPRTHSTDSASTSTLTNNDALSRAPISRTPGTQTPFSASSVDSFGSEAFDSVSSPPSFKRQTSAQSIAAHNAWPKYDHRATHTTIRSRTAQMLALYRDPKATLNAYRHVRMRGGQRQMSSMIGNDIPFRKPKRAVTIRAWDMWQDSEVLLKIVPSTAAGIREMDIMLKLNDRGDQYAPVVRDGFQLCFDPCAGVDAYVHQQLRTKRLPASVMRAATSNLGQAAWGDHHKGSITVINMDDTRSSNESVYLPDTDSNSSLNKGSTSSQDGSLFSGMFVSDRISRSEKAYVPCHVNTQRDLEALLSLSARHAEIAAHDTTGQADEVMEAQKQNDDGWIGSHDSQSTDHIVTLPSSLTELFRHGVRTGNASPADGVQWTRNENYEGDIMWQRQSALYRLSTNTVPNAGYDNGLRYVYSEEVDDLLAWVIVMEAGHPKNSLDTFNSADVRPNDVVSIARQIVKNVRVLHKLGYVHCDLKPAHFVRFHENDWKLIDYGSCLRIGDTIRPTCTPWYTAPELIDGSMAVNQPFITERSDDMGILCSQSASSNKLNRSICRQNIPVGGVSTSIDMWSLGLVLYRLFTGVEFEWGPRLKVSQKLSKLNLNAFQRLHRESMINDPSGMADAWLRQIEELTRLDRNSLACAIISGADIRIDENPDAWLFQLPARPSRADKVGSSNTTNLHRKHSIASITHGNGGAKDISDRISHTKSINQGTGSNRNAKSHQNPFAFPDDESVGVYDGDSDGTGNYYSKHESEVQLSPAQSKGLNPAQHPSLSLFNSHTRFTVVAGEAPSDSDISEDAERNFITYRDPKKERYRQRQLNKGITTSSRSHGSVVKAAQNERKSSRYGNLGKTVKLGSKQASANFAEIVHANFVRAKALKAPQKRLLEELLVRDPRQRISASSLLSKTIFDDVALHDTEEAKIRDVLAVFPDPTHSRSEAVGDFPLPNLVLHLRREIEHICMILREHAVIHSAAVWPDSVDDPLEEHRPIILQFSGHGHLSRRQLPGAGHAAAFESLLAFESSAPGKRGELHLLTGHELIQMLHKHLVLSYAQIARARAQGTNLASPVGSRLRCLFFNCCQARLLSEQVVARFSQLAAVGWDSIVSNEAASAFALGFYAEFAKQLRHAERHGHSHPAVSTPAVSVSQGTNEHGNRCTSHQNSNVRTHSRCPSSKDTACNLQSNLGRPRANTNSQSIASTHSTLIDEEGVSSAGEDSERDDDLEFPDEFDLGVNISCEMMREQGYSLNRPDTAFIQTSVSDSSRNHLRLNQVDHAWQQLLRHRLSVIHESPHNSADTNLINTFTDMWLHDDPITDHISAIMHQLYAWRDVPKNSDGFNWLRRACRAGLRCFAAAGFCLGDPALHLKYGRRAERLPSHIYSGSSATFPTRSSNQNPGTNTPVLRSTVSFGGLTLQTNTYSWPPVHGKPHLICSRDLTRMQQEEANLQDAIMTQSNIIQSTSINDLIKVQHDSSSVFNNVTSSHTSSKTNDTNIYEPKLEESIIQHTTQTVNQSSESTLLSTKSMMIPSIVHAQQKTFDPPDLSNLDSLVSNTNSSKPPRAPSYAAALKASLPATSTHRKGQVSTNTAELKRSNEKRFVNKNHGTTRDGGGCHKNTGHETCHGNQGNGASPHVQISNSIKFDHTDKRSSSRFSSLRSSKTGKPRISQNQKSSAFAIGSNKSLQHVSNSTMKARNRSNSSSKAEILWSNRYDIIQKQTTSSFSESPFIQRLSQSNRSLPQSNRSLPQSNRSLPQSNRSLPQSNGSHNSGNALKLYSTSTSIAKLVVHDKEMMQSLSNTTNSQVSCVAASNKNTSHDELQRAPRKLSPTHTVDTSGFTVFGYNDHLKDNKTQTDNSQSIHDKQPVYSLQKESQSYIRPTTTVHSQLHIPSDSSIYTVNEPSSNSMLSVSHSVGVHTSAASTDAGQQNTTHDSVNNQTSTLSLPSWWDTNSNRQDIATLLSYMPPTGPAFGRCAISELLPRERAYSPSSSSDN